MSVANDAKFSLKVMINKEKTKVLFAEANSDFVDVLLSFLTMPLGKVVKVLEKHYGDEAPVIGSLNTMYRGLANMDSVHFWTEGAKQLLLNPRSSFESGCRRLKLDISDTHPPEYFTCLNHFRRRPITSIYWDFAKCVLCYTDMKKEIGEKESDAASGYGGVFTRNTASFIVSDDLLILPAMTQLVQVINIFGFTDTLGASLMNVTLGFNEITDLFKASLSSPTPLSDIILTRKGQAKLLAVKSEPGSNSSFQMKTDATSNSKKIILNVVVQKSTNKLLYCYAREDFVDFIISFLSIPIGGIMSLLGRRTRFKSIDNLYRSVADLIDNKYLSLDMKNRLINMKLPHGSISENQILPLAEESLTPASIPLYRCVSSVNFPQGQGKYVKGLATYTVSDDLTVAPYCVSSIISMLSELNIPISDIMEVELQIGLQEGLRILEASLRSSCVLTDALSINLISKMKKEQPN